MERERVRERRGRNGDKSRGRDESLIVLLSTSN
jgi:hypothetical protein